MRKILFRGKRIDNGEWEYGGCVFTENKVCLIYNQTHSTDLQGCTVEENSVGQYTGLTDKNGTRVFEGDIISCGYLCDFFVEYSEEDAEYWANFGDSIGSLHTYFDPKKATVIGNIHDNPELLGVKE